MKNYKQRLGYLIAAAVLFGLPLVYVCQIVIFSFTPLSLSQPVYYELKQD